MLVQACSTSVQYLNDTQGNIHGIFIGFFHDTHCVFWGNAGKYYSRVIHERK
jgi:uncharacterized protein (DUF427 family)